MMSLAVGSEKTESMRGNSRRRTHHHRLPDQSPGHRFHSRSPGFCAYQKLLMHKDEIRRLAGKVEHDKRDTLKDREGKREVEHAMKSRSR